MFVFGEDLSWDMFVVTGLCMGVLFIGWLGGKKCVFWGRIDFFGYGVFFEKVFCR